MFLLHGAPDLALTQVLVETVTLVVFVAGAAPAAQVLHRPAAALDPLVAAGDRRRWSARSPWCVGLAGGCGARIAAPVSEAFPEAAYTFGYGKNIVNVTLVDIRAWDTLGEISVLVVAATGVASLIFLRSRYSGPAAAAGDRAAAAPATGRPARHGTGLAARRRDAVAGAAARSSSRCHPAALPGDDRVSCLPAVRRPQRPGRRVRRRAGRRPRAGRSATSPAAATSSTRPRRSTPAGCSASACCSPASGLARPGAVRRRIGQSCDIASTATRPADPWGRSLLGDVAPRHLGVLRHRRLPGRHRGGARPGPQPRRRHRPARGRGPARPTAGQRRPAAARRAACA